ncbi:MAG TPA: hypothetical protein VJA46_13130 [Acidimicrobiia bacterium]|nr:hypothetical protein [Acidimicrobiia bacterium]
MARQRIVAGLALVLVASACTSAENAEVGISSTIAASSHANFGTSETGTSPNTSLPPSESTPVGFTRIWLADPVSLRRGTEFVLPGYANPPLSIGGDRFVVPSWKDGVSEGPQLMSIVSSNGLNISTFEISLLPVEVVGWSDSLQRVVWIGGTDQTPMLSALNPETGEVEDLFPLEYWLEDSVLLDGGTTLAGYIPGWWPSGNGYPTKIVLHDMASGSMQWQVELEDVVEGIVPNGNPGQAEVHNDLVFDPAEATAYVVHGDGRGVTAVDLTSGEVGTVRIDGTPLTLPEDELPGITLTGFGLLSTDGGRLLIGGSTHNGTRLVERNNAIQMSRVPYPARVFDTEAMRFIAELDTTVSSGVTAGSTWAVTSETSDVIYCDQECDPANSNPEVLFEHRERPGLTIIDQTSFAVLGTVWPGANFHHFAGVSGQQVIVESVSDDGQHDLSIEGAAAEITGQVPNGDGFFIALDGAVFEMQHES